MKKKSAKEMAEMRKLQQQRAMDNKKREQSFFYQLGVKMTDSLIHFFAWIVQAVLLLFSGLSVITSIIVVLLFIFVIAFLFFSLYSGDVTGIIFSCIAIPIIGLGLWLVKKK